jgi:hypothetical protein
MLKSSKDLSSHLVQMMPVFDIVESWFQGAFRGMSYTACVLAGNVARCCKVADALKRDGIQGASVALAT